MTYSFTDTYNPGAPLTKVNVVVYVHCMWQHLLTVWWPHTWSLTLVRGAPVWLQISYRICQKHHNEIHSPKKQHNTQIRIIDFLLTIDKSRYNYCYLEIKITRTGKITSHYM